MACLSIVIPIFNEREALPHCLDRLSEVVAPLDLETELVFVDDGGTDDGGAYLIEAARTDTRIRLLRLSRNFGKEAALSAGLDYARGDAVIIMDADLQDPPEWIPVMLDYWRAGRDQVLMQRRTREGETWFKCVSARLFYWLIGRASDVPIPANVGDFRLMSRRAVNALLQLPERNRFMKGLLTWVGMPTEIISYDRPPRTAGETKWKPLSLLKLAWEGITSFSIAPLRLVTVIGICAAAIGLFFGFWIEIKALAIGGDPPGYPSLIAIITFLGGVQLISIGILGEYVGKTYIETKQRPLYLIRDIHGDARVDPAPRADDMREGRS